MKKFEIPEMEVIRFEAEDILLASGGGAGDANTPDDEF